MAELKKGNNRVLAELYKVFPMIKKYVLKNGGDQEDAKDLFQNAVLIFYRNLQKQD